jgi:hypothetical protein
MNIALCRSKGKIPTTAELDTTFQKMRRDCHYHTLQKTVDRYDWRNSLSKTLYDDKNITSKPYYTDYDYNTKTLTTPLN